MGSRLEQKSTLVRKRIEQHAFDSEQGEEYEPSKFGGFPEYFRRKKIKLQNLDAQVRAQSDKPQIFRGVVCHVNGYTQPSLQDLHVMIVQYGGGFIQYLDGKTMVTHIVASNLTPKKKEEFKRYRIVKPAWIVDSIQAGKLLPWESYRVLDEGVKQKVLGFENGQIISQAGKNATRYKEQTDGSWYTEQLRSGDALAKQMSLDEPNILEESPTAGPSAKSNVEIDDQEELTSSVEQAFNSPSHLESNEAASILEVRIITEDVLSTLSSPHEACLDDLADEETKNDDTPCRVSDLQAREGSQEPDYSMAVIANSDVLNKISPERLADMTAEEHNALLLSDPKIRKSTVVHPDFLEQYYRESRLHHLSTWKADLKSQLQALASEKSSPASKSKKPPGQRRYIMHVDFDSFFAAVSLKKLPQYKEKPAVVAHGGGSGSEIASCNYPARKYGIKNGMWMRRAQELCPDLKILPYDFLAYEDASRKFYDAILATGGVVQSVSIDEALIDISSLCFSEAGTDGVKRDEGGVFREQHKSDEIAQHLRDEVFKSTGCAVSVGIGGNILQAKVALRKAKPAGQYHLLPEDVLEFIGSLEVQALPGIAWSIGGKLEEIGIRFVRDVRECSREKLITTLGPKTGEKIREYARGIDRAEVGDQVVRKSVSAEINWGVRFENQDQVDEFMVGLSDELHKRLVKERVKGKQLTLKVMRRAADAPLDPPKHLGHGKCDTCNKSIQLGISTNESARISKEAIAMIRSLAISPGELRGIGVQMQKLEQIKTGLEGQARSSQKRLQFKSGPSTVQDESFEECLQMPAALEMKKEANVLQQNSVVDTETQTVIPLRNVGPSTPRKKPLNIAGTQFVLPSQVDAEVLVELPEDIRSRFVKRGQTDNQASRQGLDDLNAASGAANHRSIDAAMPSESQLDPAILDALPDELRTEVMAMYKSPQKAREQSLLPQSPHKSRILPPSRQPLKRKRGGSSISRLRNSTDNSTLTQTNFISRLNGHQLFDAGKRTATDAESEVDDVDEEFLSALPEELRQEVLAHQRQVRLQRTGGIDTSLHQRSTTLRNKKREKAGPLDRLLLLNSPAPLPTFTARRLSSLEDLRSAIKAWYQEFRDEGPYDDDVAALVDYLKQVVSDEKNIEKAVALLRWFAWILEEGRQQIADEVQQEWMSALDLVKHGISSAACARGIVNICIDE